MFLLDVVPCPDKVIDYTTPKMKLQLIRRRSPHSFIYCVQAYVFKSVFTHAIHYIVFLKLELLFLFVYLTFCFFTTCRHFALSNTFTSSKNFFSTPCSFDSVLMIDYSTASMSFLLATIRDPREGA